MRSSRGEAALGVRVERGTLALVLSVLATVIGFKSIAAQEWITGSAGRSTLVELPEERLELCRAVGQRRLSARFVALDCRERKLELDVSNLALDIDLDSADGSLTADLVLFDLGVVRQGEESFQRIRTRFGPYEIEIELGFEPGMTAITGVIGAMPTPYTLRIENARTGRRWVWSGVAGGEGEQTGEAAPAETYGLALVLDSSGSMNSNDPRGMRKLGSRLLVDRMPTGSRLSVVDFDDRAVVKTSDSVDTAAVKRAIDSVNSQGGTAICRGLQAAHGELQRSVASKKAAVLFTDGQSNDRCSGGQFAQRGWKLYTVGLSNAADGARLDQLARSTGAEYVHARSAGDLQRLFDLVAADLLAEATILDVSGVARPKGLERFSFYVDRTLAWLVGTLSWPGSDLDLVLVSPSGRRYSAGDLGSTASTYESLRVDRPEAGTWSAEVASIDVPLSGERFRLRAGGESSIGIGVETTKAPSSTGDAIELVARLENFPPGAPQVSVEVETPDGQHQSKQVTSGGAEYRMSFFDTFKTGAYTFRWLAKVGNIARRFSRTVFVGGRAFNPRVGRITRVEGVYLRWARGREHGMRSGMKVYFYRAGRRVGDGQVLDVRTRESDLEVFTVTGVAELRVGDRAEVDRLDWVGTGN